MIFNYHEKSFFNFNYMHIIVLYLFNLSKNSK